MDTPSSPTLSSVSFGEEEWDLISGGSESVGHFSPSAPASTAGDDFDSDVERETPQTEAFYELPASPADEVVSGDEEEPHELDDAVLRESDRRVGDALASSLSSTLDPFKKPLPDYLSPSLSGSGLVLSFPDPLTPSQELPAASVNDDAILGAKSEPTKHLEQTFIVDVDQSAIDTFFDASKSKVIEDVSPAAGSIVAGGASPARGDVTPEIVEEKAETPSTAEVFVSRREARDLRKIASYVPRKRSAVAKRRLSEGTIAQLFHTPTVPHTWATSIVISILALVLGSTIFAAQTYLPTTATRQPVPSRVTVLPLKTLDAYVTLEVPKSVGHTTPGSPPTIFLETVPAASASVGSTTGQHGAVPSTKSVAPAGQDRQIAEASCSTDSVSKAATPSATASSFWSKGTIKGKEKEVVNVWKYWDEQDQLLDEDVLEPLLLDGPSDLSAAFKHVFQGLKTSVLNNPLSLSTELLAFPRPDWLANFEQVLDMLIARVLVQTSSLLRQVSTMVSNQASSIISNSSVQSARERLIQHHERVKQKTQRIARAVHAHHKRARRNVKMCSQKMEEHFGSLSKQATELSARMDVQSFVKGVRAHHGRVKANVRNGRKMIKKRLREGQRLINEALNSRCEDNGEGVDTICQPLRRGFASFA